MNCAYCRDRQWMRLKYNLTLDAASPLGRGINIPNS